MIPSNRSELQLKGLSMVTDVVFDESCNEIVGVVVSWLQTH